MKVIEELLELENNNYCYERSPGNKRNLNGAARDSVLMEAPFVGICNYLFLNSLDCKHIKEQFSKS